jgi:phage FluMu protein Com
LAIEETTMIPVGKCPKCEAVVQRAQFDNIEIGSIPGGLGRPILNGYTINCPKCQTILGAGFDPIALKADIVDEVLRGLGVKRGK